MTGASLPLTESLALASAALANAAVVNAALLPPGASRLRSVGDDPFGLHLPPLGPTGGGEFNLAPEALRVLAGLYLHAELEQAGIVIAAEALAGERDGLPIRSPETAARLEAFFRKRRDWYDRAARDTLYARLFGSGAAANNSEGAAINREFQQALGSLCLSVVRYGEALRYDSRFDPVRDALVREMARELAANLALRQYGNTVIAARKLHEQMDQAIVLLKDPQIGVLLNAQGLWGVLRSLFGQGAPDMGRLLALGQNGQQVLSWLASVLNVIGETQPIRPLLGPGDTVYLPAARWLEASGLGQATKRAAAAASAG